MKYLHVFIVVNILKFSGDMLSFLKNHVKVFLKIRYGYIKKYLNYFLCKIYCLYSWKYLNLNLNFEVLVWTEVNGIFVLF